MHEILERLGPEAIVLDLGSRSGSFARAATRACVVRMDLDSSTASDFVQADARRMPFRDASIAAVIANHSLEHVEGLDECLTEIGRVLQPEGQLYVAVPDSSTLSDRVYRWLSHGGGHVNGIEDASAFAERIQKPVPLPLAGIRLLHTSFAYLNCHGPVRWSRRIYLLGGGAEWTLRLASIAFRHCDRLFGTRWSVYGWAFYFGKLPPIDPVPSVNVCIRCGAAHVSEWLLALGIVRRRWLGREFACPECGARNAFTDDLPRSF
ncbi:class I SAM-dependent methyltransferase [Bryobacter aggregatus]|uniref:class I SAM-dependent methyltransferase n=1 Tax=Bryobacter aggregatus TaxID=360054 RepID=UPI0004E15DF0|nr:class I SAM-dependent methyltransferase [Bryobacter aggregatus]